MDEQKQKEFKSSPLANWGFEGEGLVKGAHKLVKVRRENALYRHTFSMVIPGSDKMIISTVCTTAPN
jgi:hypothetical protein